MEEGRTQSKHIATLDVGTTTLRCHVIDEHLNVVSTASTEVALLYPEPGFVEINPDELWEGVQNVIKNAIAGANLTPEDISCLAISTQRSTFITWQRNNGKPFHNFITWKDMRSKGLVKSWNNSLTMKGFRIGAYLVYFFTRNRRYLMGSDLKLTTIQCTCRLLWVLENVPTVAREARARNVCFATLDTWLVYRLSGHRQFVSDVANASSTGLFDPFAMRWSDWPAGLLGLPDHVYPTVVAGDRDLGNTSYEIFGASIPVKCMTADQQASMFAARFLGGHGLKATLGTGGFVDSLTGAAPHGSTSGIYPLVAWQLDGKATYMAEAACNDTGSLIRWLLDIGIIDDPESTSDLAGRVADSDGVHFVPAFSGLGPPISDDSAASGFLGVRPTTRREHLLRAVLESIVYRIVLAFELLKSERDEPHETMCVDGGVSKNDFVCQMLADMSNLEVVRLHTHDLSVIGATLIAGVNHGIWRYEDAARFGKARTVFRPSSDPELRKRLRHNLDEWSNVVSRFKSWYLD